MLRKHVLSGIVEEREVLGSCSRSGFSASKASSRKFKAGTRDCLERTHSSTCPAQRQDFRHMLRGGVAFSHSEVSCVTCHLSWMSVPLFGVTFSPCWVSWLQGAAPAPPHTCHNPATCVPCWLAGALLFVSSRGSPSWMSQICQSHATSPC